MKLKYWTTCLVLAATPFAYADNSLDLSKLKIDDSQLGQPSKIEITVSPRIELFDQKKDDSGNIEFVRVGGPTLSEQITATIPFLNKEAVQPENPYPAQKVKSQLVLDKGDGSSSPTLSKIQDSFAITDDIQAQLPMELGSDEKYHFLPTALAAIESAETQLLSKGEVGMLVQTCKAMLGLRPTPYKIDPSDFVISDSRDNGQGSSAAANDPDSSIGVLEKRDDGKWQFTYRPYTLTISFTAKRAVN